MQKYIVDTCIWRDFYEARKNRFGEDIGVKASHFFETAMKGGSIIYYSDALMSELGNEYGITEIENMLFLFFHLGTLKKIPIEKEDIVSAKVLSQERNIPFVDALLALHAKKYNAIVITRDRHFFDTLLDICTAKKPEKIS